MIVHPGQANILSADAVARADGSPITAGTVNFYLYAKDGTNATKWYKGSDATWNAAEQVAGAATHKGDGHWILSLASAVWTTGVAYLLYAKETGDLHVPVSQDILCEAVPTTLGGGASAWTYTLFTRPPWMKSFT